MAERAARKPVRDAEALAMVMEMMAISGRSGEEAVIMDFIRKKLAAAGIPAVLSRWTTLIAVHHWVGKSAIWY